MEVRVGKELAAGKQKMYKGQQPKKIDWSRMLVKVG